MIHERGPSGDRAEISMDRPTSNLRFMLVRMLVGTAIGVVLVLLGLAFLTDEEGTLGLAIAVALIPGAIAGGSIGAVWGIKRMAQPPKRLDSD